MKPSPKLFRFKFPAPVFFLVLLLAACKERDRTAEAVSKVPLELEILRFDREFAQSEAGDLPSLKQRYPFLFPAQYPDSIWVAKMADSLQFELSTEVERAFGDFGEETRDLESLFRHIKYYFPDHRPPKVITLVSDVRYRERVLLADTLLLIGLDNYLGEDHRFYGGLQRYIAESLDRRYLLSDVASAFAKTVVHYPEQRSFLSKMVHYGKELYLKDLLLPDLGDDQKIGYSPEDLQWAGENEQQIWRYIVERGLLYDTDSDLERRFLDPAPFSKFGLELDRESPARLGRYMGWQIVRAYMERNETGLQELLELPADEIFKNSNYKPRK